MGLIMISYQCLVVALLCAAACGSGAPAARMKVAVEGVVYCKVCIRNPNSSFHLEAIMAPMEGAVVKLQCNNTNKGPWELETKTDGNAHFLFTPERVSSWGAHKCRIFLVSSPSSDCIAPIGNPYFDDTPWKSETETESEEIDSPEVERLRKDLLDGIDEDSDLCTSIHDLDSFMKSFEDEITTSPTSSHGSGAAEERIIESASDCGESGEVEEGIVELVSDSGESRPDLGYLLEASDDELGIPPPAASSVRKELVTGEEYLGEAELLRAVSATWLFCAAIPALLVSGFSVPVAILGIAESLEKLMDATREELPDTMVVVQLSGMEISDLTMELSDNGSG
ncbi:hypothetical protein SASPL_144267 [Salvia splendens]|uniref:Uncharacterized protein n=1 Tax=Salvia splendens TaxID=180675 RepID=A0A8X8WFE0_SALSN|nr:hypothetical protein SASPL_144267 [Salvia splendens]